MPWLAGDEYRTPVCQLLASSSRASVTPHQCGIPGRHAWLGYGSAELLFVSSSASPYNHDGTNRIAPAGLIGWIAWIVVYSINLLGR